MPLTKPTNGLAIKLGLALAACLPLIACHRQDDFANSSEAELHAQAGKLPLQERYALYERVFHSRTPSNPVLADDIAKLGEDGFRYAVQRGAKGDFDALNASFPVLGAGHRKCSAEEFSALLASVERNSSGRSRDAMKDYLTSVCNKTEPVALRKSRSS